MRKIKQPTALEVFDEWANKVSIGHAAVQIKAASLATRLLALLPPTGRLTEWVKFVSPRWVLLKGHKWEVQWSIITANARFSGEPEDWWETVKQWRKIIA